jgi:hypothetical protein
MTPEELTELWTSRIRDYRASGERVAAWCERHQVTPYQFFYWQRKLRLAEQETPATSKPQWLPVRVGESATAGASPIVVRIGAAAIEVRPGFEPSLLAEVVRALKTLC